MDEMRNSLGGGNNGGRNNFQGNGNRAQVGNGNGGATRTRGNGNGYGAPQGGPALATYGSG